MYNIVFIACIKNTNYLFYLLFYKILGENTLFETKNEHHSSSCVYVHFQCGVQSTLNNMIVNLFNEIIRESCFNTLRTQVPTYLH